MDEYKVIVTSHALHSMAKIRDYIASELSNPTAAVYHLRLFQRKIKKLSSMPGRYKPIDEQPWHDEGVRRMKVKNYFIYYWISEDDHIVYVTDVIYTGNDQLKQLRKMLMK